MKQTKLFTVLSFAIAISFGAGALNAQQVQQPQPQGAVPTPDFSGQPAAPYAQGAPQPVQAPINAAAPPASAPDRNLPPLPSGALPSPALENAVNANLSLTPEEVRWFRKMLNEQEKAEAELPVDAPKPVMGTVSVALSPGSTPPVVRPFAGHTTSIVVVDATGQPWPVENFSVGNETQFVVRRLDGDNGSVFAINTLFMYGQSNLVFKLAGISTPVVIDLVAGQREMDARTELRVQGRGPNAVVTANSLIRGNDARLNSVLDGVAPDHGKALIVEGSDRIRAWKMPDGKMIIRAPFRLTSVASPEFVSSADGTHVYEIPASPRVSALIDGKFVSFNIKGW